MGELKMGLTLTHKEAADVLELAPQTLHRLNSEGKGPRRVKRGKYLLYTYEDLTAWLKTRTKIFD
jgi:predicted transcriptional regulator of viral defense system